MTKLGATEERCRSMTASAWIQCERPHGHGGLHKADGLDWHTANGEDDLWTAEYRHEDGRRMLASIKAASYSAAKVSARLGEEDGFTLRRLVQG